MTEPHSLFGTLQTLDLGGGRTGQYYSLPALTQAGLGNLERLPISLRIVLESVLRNCDGKKITEQNVRDLAGWQPRAERTTEIPFVVARILLQDFTGVPLLVDLAAMRSAAARLGKSPKTVEPLVPVDLVIDHSVQVDFAGTSDAARNNLEMEFMRNRERYQFLKWSMQAFDQLKVVPPGIGIVHQVNLEHLAKGVQQSPATLNGESAPVLYPDTLVGTDSHTTMINGLGVVAWGVGGIEAEAGMLGQPVYILTPDVVGVCLTGALREGVTATDLALTVTQLLRRANVVGKFVEFFGPGAAALSLVDRTTIANMAPEYGATMGFFPMDRETVDFLRATGRSEDLCEACERYYRAQGLFGMPAPGQIDYSTEIALDLSSIVPSVAGPRRPQDRIELSALKQAFLDLLAKPASENGYGKSPEESARRLLVKGHRPINFHHEWHAGFNKARIEPSESEMRDQHPAPDNITVSRDTLKCELGHGTILIAAITSCTNTSNPSVMLAAGLLAKKAVERGLSVNPVVKTSLAPGSRVVTDYLEKTGLQPYLDRLGFHLVGYGCTTCIGNSGPLETHIEAAVVHHDLIAASVLSGNRNFEARVHQSIKANFLMSPPLVVAFALAGRIDIDLTAEPLGRDAEGRPVFLKDVWPRQEEIRDLLHSTLKPEVYRRLYSDFTTQNPRWNEIQSSGGDVYQWDPTSGYIQEPPFFASFSRRPSAIAGIKGARVLGIFGDSVTTDHISPAGAIKKDSPAGRYLLDHHVAIENFNSYGSRRGNDRVMTRGTFANVLIKNLMLGGEAGGDTLYQPTGERMSIYDAAMRYAETKTPLIVIAGSEYGTGSSRDWAAKGPALLGVRAVVARSFERIHRSNLVGMGILPLEFKNGVSAQTLKLDGTEVYAVQGLGPGLKPRQDVTLWVRRTNGSVEHVPLTCRVDTPIEIEYYHHGGILPCVLRQLLAKA
ncbi:MAG: aconitate hydratase [Verrucomicrobia bacterium]|nr:aconitate hydratase [Verrucomicrobiota bacterium]OQC65672.1 MAG: Aconitate hydratase [Verrucomicrobia bacterium ADurb.Bin006]MDI9379395.1 aconitate hydratase [Verrucomicrobiota bacterium]NMD22403.1 aconitate hydratase [Verrucomicrobiota bacterium]HOA60415.1 aconitate hydratase [Verrucomicrobiota bacterium]